MFNSRLLMNWLSMALQIPQRLPWQLRPQIQSPLRSRPGIQKTKPQFTGTPYITSQSLGTGTRQPSPMALKNSALTTCYADKSIIFMLWHTTSKSIWSLKIFLIALFIETVKIGLKVNDIVAHLKMKIIIFKFLLCIC